MSILTSNEYIQYSINKRKRLDALGYVNVRHILDRGTICLDSKSSDRVATIIVNHLIRHYNIDIDLNISVSLAVDPTVKLMEATGRSTFALDISIDDSQAKVVAILESFTPF